MAEEMDEKELIQLLQSRRERSALRRWYCPDEAQLAAYAEGRLADIALRRFESHLADCAFCLRHVAFLLQLQEVEPPAEVPPSLLAQAREIVQRQSPRLTWRWATASAVAAGFAIAVMVWFREQQLPVFSPKPSPAPHTQIAPPTAAPNQPPSETPRTVRKAEKKSFVPEVLFPREGTSVFREALEFRWKAVPRSVFYEIRMVTETGDLVWEAQTTGTSARLPREIQLEPGQKYFVWVHAYLPEGKTVRSKAVGFKASTSG